MKPVEHLEKSTARFAVRSSVWKRSGTLSHVWFAKFSPQCFRKDLKQHPSRELLRLWHKYVSLLLSFNGIAQQGRDEILVPETKKGVGQQ